MPVSAMADAVARALRSSRSTSGSTIATATWPPAGRADVKRQRAIYKAVRQNTDQEMIEGGIGPILKTIKASGYTATPEEVEETRRFFKKPQAKEAR